MSSELEVALAQLFRKKGKASLTEKEFVFAASLDFRWFSPKDAQRFMELSIDSELLKRDGDKVFLAFDFQSIGVMPGYKPNVEILRTAAQPKGIFMILVDNVSGARGMPRKDVVSLVNATQDAMGIEPEVAALVVAQELGVDISQYLDKVEEEVAKRFKKMQRGF
jgi:hypothetical protein